MNGLAEKDVAPETFGPVELAGVPVRISWKFDESVRGFPSERGLPGEPKNMRLPHHNKFTITISNAETLRYRKFAFYGSTAEYEKEIRVLDVQTLHDALYYIFLDGASGGMSFVDFLYEFGYTGEAAKSAKKIWEACERTREKLRDIGFDDDKIYEAMAWMQQKGWGQ